MGWWGRWGFRVARAIERHFHNFAPYLLWHYSACIFRGEGFKGFMFFFAFFGIFSVETIFFCCISCYCFVLFVNGVLLN